jgi:K+-transporting ATPase ATPase C chain
MAVGKPPNSSRPQPFAKARGIFEDRIHQLIEDQITARQLEMLGEQRVNVLNLNLALDQFSK